MVSGGPADSAGGAIHATHAADRSGKLVAWVLAARLPTLPAAVVPVLVGTAEAAAHGAFRPLVLVAALVAAVLIQVGTNLANDYFDYQKGTDAVGRLGPPRVTQSGLLAPATVRNGMLLTFGLAGLIGVYLVTVGGWPILLVGVLGIAAGVLYTGGPWPFGYHGLGDPVVFIFFGPVAVLGTIYLHGAPLSGEALVASLPVGLLVTAILVVNNVRDLETDRVAGKRTLAVRIGRSASRVEYVLLVAGAYLVPLGRWLVGSGALPWSLMTLLPWLTLPLAIALGRVVSRAEGRALNEALRRTAQLHLFFGVLFAASLLW
jgi:1,4-dihydroxy-2-naphthoate octaprenyltransferase